MILRVGSEQLGEVVVGVEEGARTIDVEVTQAMSREQFLACIGHARGGELTMAEAAAANHAYTVCSHRLMDRRVEELAEELRRCRIVREQGGTWYLAVREQDGEQGEHLDTYLIASDAICADLPLVIE